MAFRVIAPYIEAIEEGLRRGESPAAIAKRLGIPEKEKTISRYRAARFNPLKEARELWEIERGKTPEQRLAEGKAPIIDTLEVVNLAKLRAMQLLQLEVGTPYKTAGGEEREMSWPSVSSYWQTGARMICDLAKIEMELAGNDAESRKADAWVDLVEMIGDRMEGGTD
ncbi:hypothetical protein [Methanothrix sp.]|uniref:hypothetical protein n=1 Tax=Methanothrix sp. TaxID=90426 RepID=UPI003D1399AB